MTICWESFGEKMGRVSEVWKFCSVQSSTTTRLYITDTTWIVVQYFMKSTNASRMHRPLRSHNKLTTRINDWTIIHFAYLLNHYAERFPLSADSQNIPHGYTSVLYLLRKTLSAVFCQCLLSCSLLPNSFENHAEACIQILYFLIGNSSNNWWFRYQCWIKWLWISLYDKHKKSYYQTLQLNMPLFWFWGPHVYCVIINT